MNQMICLILCLTLWASTFAERWSPENMEKLSAKCLEQNPLPLDSEAVDKDITKITKIHAVALCIVKGANLYSEESGFNIDRLAMAFFRNTDIPEGGKSMVQNCVDKYKDVVSSGEMIVEVVMCMEEGKRKMPTRL